MYNYFDLIRLCLLCGKSEPPLNILCKNCWDIYFNESKKINFSVSLNYQFPVRRVWQWEKNNDYIIRKLIYSLKRGHSRQVYRQLASLLLSKVNFYECKEKNILFIPAPNINKKKNHALFLARELSELTGAEYLDVLCNKKLNVKQKKLKKSERQNKLMKVEGEPLNLKGKKIIFVDDVIATGFTALAAYNALEKPLYFEVWVLAEKLLETTPMKSISLENRVGCSE